MRKVIRLARYGLGVMRRPSAAALAIFFQMLGWLCQLFAVWTAMRAFDIHEPLPAAGLVLVLMNVATLFPLWPGNIGLVQAAVALPLVHATTASPKANGIAFGFGLQAIEASVGIGVGPDLPRARGTVVRDAQGDARRVAGRDAGGEPPPSRGGRCRAHARSRVRLASKAFSPRARPRPRSATDCATWADADELPVADGGEGTLDALHAALGGEWRDVDVSDAFGRPRRARWLLLPDGTAAVEAAEAIPLDPARLDAMHASSRGLGELIRAVGEPAQLLVCLGGTANVDGGRGLLAELDALPAADSRCVRRRRAARRRGARLRRAEGRDCRQALELEARLARR